FNDNGELVALSEQCPHKGGSLSRGKLTGAITSSEPGNYQYSRPGEIIRCPWHAWEFDLRTGRSWCDPQRMRLMNYAVSVEPGAKLAQGPYAAETFAVTAEAAYVVVRANSPRRPPRPAAAPSHRPPSSTRCPKPTRLPVAPLGAALHHAGPETAPAGAGGCRSRPGKPYGKRR